MFLVIIVFGSLAIFAFGALVYTFKYIDSHREQVERDLFYALIQEETEPASEVFETLEKAGIEVNYLGSKNKNNETKEPEFKVISV